MLSRLRVMRLRFEMQVLNEVELPAYKGDLLRRALLWQLGTMWCRQGERCRNGCQEPDECLFGRLLEPPVDPGWSKAIRRLMGTTPPPAYVLWDDRDRRRKVGSGDLFRFELSLIGEPVIRQMPAFIAAMMVAGEQGMGRERLKGRLCRVDALTGPLEQPRALLVDGVWQGGSIADLAIDWTDGEAWAEGVASGADGPFTRLSIGFLSPFNVKMQGDTAQQPAFPALARAMVRRLRILSEVHGAGEWRHEAYGPLLDLADEVRLEHHETTWVQAERHSRRGGWMPGGGLVGQAWYAAETDLRPLLPALWLGQWVHAGKGATWGWGRYALVKEENGSVV